MIDFSIFNEDIFGPSRNRERASVTTREKITWTQEQGVRLITVVIKAVQNNTSIYADDGLAITFNAVDDAQADSRLAGVDGEALDTFRWCIPMVTPVARFQFSKLDVLRADFKSLSNKGVYVWIGAD